jgi:hypothetical protein
VPQPLPPLARTSGGNHLWPIDRPRVRGDLGPEAMD